VVSRKNSWSSVSTISIAILFRSVIGTAILARFWASRNFGAGKSAVACAAVGAFARDPEITATQLASWLSEVAGITGVSVDRLEIPSSTGWSNETVMFDGTWADPAGVLRTRPLVVRIAPLEYRVFLEANFESQYRVMQALADHTDVPMPEMLWFEADPSWFGSPFWIMARIDGVVPGDSPAYAASGWLHDAAPEQQAETWWSGIEAMAAVHRVDWRTLDLDFLDDPARGASGLEQQLQYYAESLEWAEGGTPHPGARAALDWLRAEMPPAPPYGDTIVWGDSRLSNQIYRDHQVVAVLDWEMVALGDPRIDLGWWLFCDDALSAGAGCPRLPGFPSAEETVARWEELTGRSGDHLHYFLVFAGLRFTVVMLRLSTLLVDLGYSPEPFGYDNDISRALDQLMSETSITE
jgi:aminoglycoside phosphotransferase (APT) family kinase protein